MGLWTAVATEQPRGTSRRRILLLSIFLVVVAVIVRLPGITRPFVLDDAWVANSVLEPSIHNCLRYDPWLQTSPPLFLILVRVFSQTFGASVLVLRALPFLFGIGSVLLSLLLGLRLFGPPFAMILGGVAAISPVLISLSVRLKQYSSDLFCGLVLLFMIWKYVQRPTRSNFIWLLAVFSLCLSLSYTSVMFLPLCGCAILFRPSDSGQTWRRIASFALVTSGIFLVLYFCFIKPNQSTELNLYWLQLGKFPTKGSISSLTKFYFSFLSSSFYIFYPRGKEVFSRFFEVLALFGAFAITLRIRRHRSREIAMLAGLPIATAVVLNTLGKYPLYANTLAIFLFPCLGILVVYGAECIYEIIIKRISLAESWMNSVPIALGMTLVVAAAILQYTRPPSVDGPAEDGAAAVRFLAENARPGDLVYVHASAEEQIKLYLRLLHTQAVAPVFGDTGWPCCTRHHQFETGPVDDNYVMSDFENTVRARQGRVLLVFADRQDHWHWLGRNERQIILRHLGDLACHDAGTFQAGSMVIDDVQCGGSYSAASFPIRAVSGSYRGAPESP